MKKKIILASGSPRRREILRQIGLDFSIEPADIDEGVKPSEPPLAYAVRVAKEKAEMAGKRTAEGIIIAADTIVVCNNLILGKPSDPADAGRMLRMLSGRMHQVITGLAVMDAASGRMAADSAVTMVWFRELTDREIGAYIATGEPLDKAGAYGIQGMGGLLVDRIEGCYFNVVGLPISLLYRILKDFGIDILMWDAW